MDTGDRSSLQGTPPIIQAPEGKLAAIPEQRDPKKAASAGHAKDVDLHWYGRSPCDLLLDLNIQILLHRRCFN